jgi:protein-L-isoaspartate(D-aspartate) O-methyltransferase
VRFPSLYITLAALLMVIALHSEALGGESPRALTITLAGDIIPLSEKATAIAEGTGGLFDNVAALLREGDIVMGNLETPLVEGGLPSNGQVIHHHAAMAAASELARVPFTVLSIANNHILDYGTAGLESTIQALEKNGMKPLGAAGRESIIMERNGLTLTFLSFTGGYPLASHYSDFPVCMADIEIMEKRVRACASRGPVIVALHWGEEDSDTPSPEQREMAHRLVRAGAAIIAGHHPHVTQALEYDGKALIAYSLGNFAWPGARGHRAESLILSVTLTDKGVTACRAAPVRIAHGCPELLRGQEAQESARRLWVLCGEAGTPSSVRNGFLFIPQQEPCPEPGAITIDGSEKALQREGTLTVFQDSSTDSPPCWQSPRDRYVMKAVAAHLMGENRQLLLLLSTLTAEKHWEGDHWVFQAGARELTEHLCVAGRGTQGGPWRTLWLSSPLERRVLDFSVEEKGGRLLLRSTESDARETGASAETISPLYEWTGWAFQEYEEPALREKREQMVTEIIDSTGITDARVIEALRRLPRHYFVPPGEAWRGYENSILPIGSGQTIPRPDFMARLAALCNLTGEERVLEIGTGSGYQAALLSYLCREVYSIEIIPDVAEAARRAWHRLGLENIHLRIGDGSEGWRGYDPYDVILVTAAPEAIPKALVDQLCEGGLMIIATGPPEAKKNLWKVKKEKDRLTFQFLGKVTMVPMEYLHEPEDVVNPPVVP